MDNKFSAAPQPYLPQKLPFNYNYLYNDNNFIKISNDALNKIGEYNGFLQTIINPMLLISPILNQEAVLSSKLEGTHATLEDLLNYQAGNKIEIEQDEVKEIQNYRKALLYALYNLGKYDENSHDKLPLTTRIIKEMHKILLDNVRGSSKRPGEFKRNQNYIGNLNEISYTPVSPELTNEYMSNLEEYIHLEDSNILIQSAIIHAQFEMIHPFEDGNGRIGRLLIPLFLYYRNVLPFPTFYMSSYFEKNRDNYINYLSLISKDNDWKKWIIFYLQGIIESAKESTEKAKYIIELYNYIKDKKISQLNSTYSINILDYMFTNPFFKIIPASKELNINKRTLYQLVNKLVELEVLESDESIKNITYYCPDLIKLIL